MNLLYALLYLLLGFVSLVYFYLRQHYSYWTRRGVVHDKPNWFFGNFHGVRRTKTFRQPFNDVYVKYHHSAPFAGFYLFIRRAVVLFDLELIKNVLIKDFSNFSTRGNFYNERDDPLTGHLFNLDGEKWRSMRAKLTPTFTSGKMKFMYPTVVEVAERFVQVLRDLVKTEAKDQGERGEVVLEIKELLARFTTDVIGTCAFGLECNSLKDPNTKFRLMGKKAFSDFRHKTVIFAFLQAYPEWSRKLRMRIIPDDVHEFFMGVVKQTVEYREKESIQRNDFMNLLLELKHNNDTEGLTIEQVAAQAFVFFLAGFETSSSTMGFAVYELAVNQDIQDNARAEINEVLSQHDGKFNYEMMRDLKYLNQILNETMRKYSIASVLIRKTINDYPVPNTKHVIEKGTVVIVPVDAIHHDPEIYPDPEKFDPERFTPEEVAKRHPMTWLPFGDGPRNCIGLRFGVMQAMVGLAMLLKHFRFSPSKSTKIPMEFETASFLLASKGGINLIVEPL